MTDLVNAADVTSGEFFKSAEHEGELLVIYPLDYRPEITTTAGTSDAIEARVIVVDGDHAGETYENGLLFGKALVPFLRGRIGTGVVGRLAKGPAQPGKTAPWVLAGVGPDDMAKATAAIQPKIASADEPPF